MNERFVHTFKANPYHDELGRFTTGGSDGSDGGSALTGKDGRAYTVTHDLGVNGEHHYRVLSAGKEIGEARLSHTGKYVVDLGVRAEHRRNGIATKLYDHIENHLGYSLKPSPVHRTEAGTAFWNTRRVKKYNPNHDELGRFSSGEGGGSTDSGGGSKVTGLEGVDLNASGFHQVKEAVDRGGFNIEAVEKKGDFGNRIIATVTPTDIPSHWQTADRWNDGNKEYFDPKYAEVSPDTGGVRLKDMSYGAFNFPNESGLIYRGMSHEEYQQSIKQGYFESRGGYNLGEEQRGLTYFSSDAQQAVSYANGFAPWQYKATPSRPAVVVAVKDPGGHVINLHLPTELGIRGRVPVDSIAQVYLGRPITVKPGKFDVTKDYYNKPSMGSGTSYSASVLWEKAEVKKFNPNHDEQGRFTTGGDSSGVGSGYSKEARVINGVIHTNNVNDAVLALHENKRVELRQLRSVSTLLDKLGKIAADMIAKGEQAPSYNLCNVSVAGSNLFCVESKGISRIEMPQIDRSRTGAFKQHLMDLGYQVRETHEKASYLRATQNELNGSKVAGIAKAIETGRFYNPEERLFVSKDNYIVDGHHRWAAFVGVDARNNRLGDRSIPVTRINIGIIDLLKEAHKFSSGGEGIDKRVRKYNENHDELGRFTTGGGVGSTSDAVTGTSEFKEWFGRSEVVDGGKPLMMYHGTGVVDIEAFKVGDGAWFSADPDLASAYSGGKSWREGLQPNIYPVYLRVENPVVLKANMNDKATYSEMRAATGLNFTVGKYGDETVDGIEQKFKVHQIVASHEFVNAAKAAGYDGIKVKEGKYFTVGVFSQNQIKSAIGNIGTFDPKNPHIGKFNPNHDELGRFTTGGGGEGDGMAGDAPGLGRGPSGLASISSGLGGGGGGIGRSGERIPTFAELTAGGVLGQDEPELNLEPDSWDTMSSSQQEAAGQAYADHIYPEMLEHEQRNWRDEQALHEGASQVASQYNDHQVYGVWINDALNEYLDKRDEEGLPRIPYTREQLLNAVKIDPGDSGWGRLRTEVDFNDDKLLEPDTWIPGQMTLPGIEESDLSAALTPEMREGLAEVVKTAFDNEAEVVADSLEPPEYLADSAREFADEHWGQMSDSERFTWAQENTNIIGGAPGRRDGPTNQPSSRGPWQERLTGGITPEQFLQGMNPTNLSGRLEIFGYGGTLKYDLSFQGGTLQRTFDFGSKDVHHDFFELPEHLQGKDVAKSIIGSQIDLYQKMGFETVSVFAALEVGKYSWAKYGFVPSERSWDRVRSSVNGLLKIDSYLKSNLSDAEHTSIGKLLANTNPKTIWALSDLKKEVVYGGKKTTLGSYLLRGAGQGWDGTLRFSDKESMERFAAYVRSTKKK